MSDTLCAGGKSRRVLSWVTKEYAVAARADGADSKVVIYDVLTLTERDVECGRVDRHWDVCDEAVGVRDGNMSLTCLEWVDVELDVV